MKRLKRWGGSAEALLDKLCIKRPAMRKARVAIKKAYTWYGLHAPELAGVVACALKPEAETELLDAYESSSEVDKVSGEIFGLAEFTCQYCGLNEAHTLDHYIPKRSYPEYAVYPDNLVPCCGRCNLKRGNRWLEKGSGARKHVHLFFEKIPARRLLAATISMTSSKPVIKYRLDLAAAPPKGFTTLYQRHVESLHLLQRYKGAAADEFKDWEAGIKLNGYGSVVGPKAIKLRFIKAAEGCAKTRGLNHWKSALLYAAGNSDSLINYLCT